MHTDCTFIKLKGRVQVSTYVKGALVDVQEHQNIILSQGHAEIIRTLVSVAPTAPRIVNRMCIGDQGTIPSNAAVPKVPTRDMSGLFNEIFRKDCEARTVRTEGATNECQFITTFSASELPSTAYSNPSEPRVNEVGLVLIDPAAAGGLVRPSVAAPEQPPEDEKVLSIRCFKSIPFEQANDVSVTIRYTISLE